MLKYVHYVCFLITSVLIVLIEVSDNIEFTEDGATQLQQGKQLVNTQ